MTEVSRDPLFAWSLGVVFDLRRDAVCGGQGCRRALVALVALMALMVVVGGILLNRAASS